MIQDIKKGVKDLRGTASELRDNRNYDKLVEMVGEPGAQRAIRHKLQERNLTEEQWIAYRETRSVLHATPLRMQEEVEEVEALRSGALSD